MNLEEWKKANPGKSLNQYYTYARKNGIDLNNDSKTNRASNIHDEYLSTSNSSQNWIKYVVICFIFFGLIITNPSETDHFNNAVDEVSTQLKNEVGDWGMLNGLKNIGSNYITKAIITVDHRRNFLLFSIQDVNFAGEKIGTSIGVVGITVVLAETN